MTLSLSIADLAHRYPTDIVNRGIELYNQDRVGDLYFEEGRVESEVEEAGDIFYPRVSLNNRGIPVDTDCSCTLCEEGGLCFHITALLVKLINEKVQLVSLPERIPGAEILREERFDDFPVSPMERGLVSESLMPLASWEAEENLPVTSPREQGGEDRDIPGRERWKGVLNLRKRGDEWRVTPALLYIKKDGTYGRLDRNFNLARITEPLSSRERELFPLFEMMAYGGEEGVPFEKTARFLLGQAEEITLVDDGGEPFRLTRADRLGLSFDPVVFPAEGRGEEQMLFSPEFLLPARKEREPFPLENTLAFMGDSLFLVRERGAEILRYDTEGKGDLIGFLLSRRDKPLTPAEIRSFRNSWGSSFDDRLQWEFTPREIRRLNITPVTVLSGYDTGTGGCAFRLSFDYGERGVFFHDRNPARSRHQAPLRCRDEETEETLVLFRRNYPLEGEIHRWLENWFLTLFGTPPYDSPLSRLRGGYDFLVQKSLTDFLMERADELLDRGIELRLEKQKGRIRKKSGGVWQFRGTAYREWLSLSLTNTDEDLGQVDLEEFLQGGMLRAGSDLIIISSDEREKLKAILEKGELEEGKLILSPYDYEALDGIEESFGFSEEDDLVRIKERADRLKDFTRIEEMPLPRDFQGTLRPYQKGGFDWLHFLSRYGLGGCLADDMGLGKTVQTLCFLQSLKEEGRLGQALLLAPVTTLPNWKREAEKFTPSLVAVIHQGGGRSRTREDLSHADLVLSSYQTFLRDADWMREEQWRYLILDEAQAVKNWQSKTRHAVKAIQADFRLALTGTPVENGMVELWSLFDLLEPGLLGTLDMFRRRYQIPMERDGDKSRTDELRRRVAPLMLRRKKEEVLTDLPEKEETLVWLEMGDDQRSVYDKARKGFLALIEETLKDKEVTQAAMEILTALLRLRQLAVAPRLADSGYEEIGSCKMDFLEYFLDDLEAENHKVLIFSQFVSALKIVAGQMDRRGFSYAYLDGSTRDREGEINRFQDEGGPSVFLISLKAGGVGINLTAADYVVLLDPWWNPAVENQAVDRAHRIGQKRSVMVYKPIVKDTVEEKILELQESKKHLSAELISEDQGFLKSLTREEVASLFR